MIPSAGGTMKLAEQIGYAAAMDLLLTARLIDGREAERIGLVTMACPAADVRPIALARAEMVAANSPVAVSAAKRLAVAGRASRYAEREAEERRVGRDVWASGHFKIGAAAFLEKRPPVYED